jgi:DNA polymerase-3 subunit gamma/tau
MTDLARKYRPQRLTDLIGQQEMVKSLRYLFQSEKLIPHSYLFVGPSGTGKTTTARIVARRLHIPRTNVVEVDGATFTGIDAARSIKDLVAMPALGAVRKKMLIVDECHRLSKPAWDSWLKILEEPPEHLYIALCTTEPSKVPTTGKTRFHTYHLKPVNEEELSKHLDIISRKEQLNVSDEVIEYIAAQSNGSPRQALMYLSQCRAVQSVKTAKVIVRKAEADVEGAEVGIARLLIAGNRDWASYMKAVKSCEHVEPESVRIVTVNYIAAVLRKQTQSKRVGQLAGWLDAFSTPYNTSDRDAPLLLSIARCLFG